MRYWLCMLLITDHRYYVHYQVHIDHYMCDPGVFYTIRSRCLQQGRWDLMQNTNTNSAEIRILYSPCS